MSTMPTQSVPADILQRSNKILFIAHLALGDFAYLQNCFQAFAKAYPHLEIHLWVDELQRTADSSRWEYLKKQALYDWLASCSFFSKVYSRTYSPALYQESIKEAAQQDYPVVVSLATLRPHLYARLARTISPRGFVAGIRGPVGLLTLHRYLAYHRLDASIPTYAGGKSRHISDVQADWFYQFFGVQITEESRFPFVQIPEEWTQYAKEKLAEWGFLPRSGKLIFINPYAKTKKRCWPLDRVVELIKAMSARDEWRDACFIVNATPQELALAKKVFDSYALERTRLFSAEENFFQLPAILKECDLIVSVETAVMHLANAVHVPVVALMRQKNPEWVPIDRDHSTVIKTRQRRDWVKAITVDQVMGALSPGSVAT
jgi:ADP-heptose:LPS heptosyltransferase